MFVKGNSQKFSINKEIKVHALASRKRLYKKMWKKSIYLHRDFPTPLNKRLRAIEFGKYNVWIYKIGKTRLEEIKHYKYLFQISLKKKKTT